MNRPQESMIGNSAALAMALDRISDVASINRPLLILGERGTGKELAAERLHFLSQRWDAPLLKVNCAAIADQLLESELFGHESGAFTGATRSHKGRFERADGGTLFLDELATMSTRLQEKLLRLVEYGEFERLGGQETLKVDVRIVAATSADLPTLAKRGDFREDLLDRLSFDVVHLPSLSQRKEDIHELAQHFAFGMCSELGWSLFPGFTDNALQQLLLHAWPGNIRELKNAVERSLYRWGDPDSAVDMIVIDPFKSPYASLMTSATVLKTPAAQSDSEHEQAVSQDISDLNAHMAATEKQLVREALARNSHNQSLTAASLGLSYDQLRGMVRKHKLSTRKRKS
ncbi:MAG: psp operon transcriptional activator [Halioglobus sp.]|jgi:psp operon transcriptional activator